MKDAIESLPPALREFLTKSNGRTIKLASSQPREADEVTFLTLDELEVRDFQLTTPRYNVEGLNTGDQLELENDDLDDIDDDLHEPVAYDIPGIDLVSEEPNGDGMLIWFPQFREFGSWDPDHGTILMFPETAWPAIEKNLADYINAQWYTDLVPCKYLRPWADPRCADLKPRDLY